MKNFNLIALFCSLSIFNLAQDGLKPDIVHRKKIAPTMCASGSRTKHTTFGATSYLFSHKDNLIATRAVGDVIKHLRVEVNLVDAISCKMTDKKNYQLVPRNVLVDQIRQLGDRLFIFLTEGNIVRKESYLIAIEIFTTDGKITFGNEIKLMTAEGRVETEQEIGFAFIDPSNEGRFLLNFNDETETFVASCQYKRNKSDSTSNQKNVSREFGVFDYELTKKCQNIASSAGKGGIYYGLTTDNRYNSYTLYKTFGGRKSGIVNSLEIHRADSLGNTTIASYDFENELITDVDMLSLGSGKILLFGFYKTHKNKPVAGTFLIQYEHDTFSSAKLEKLSFDLYAQYKRMGVNQRMRKNVRFDKQKIGFRPLLVDRMKIANDGGIIVVASQSTISTDVGKQRDLGFDQRNNTTTTTPTSQTSGVPASRSSTSGPSQSTSYMDFLVFKIDSSDFSPIWTITVPQRSQQNYHDVHFSGNYMYLNFYDYHLNSKLKENMKPAMKNSIGGMSDIAMYKIDLKNGDKERFQLVKGHKISRYKVQATNPGKLVPISGNNFVYEINYGVADYGFLKITF